MERCCEATPHDSPRSNQRSNQKRFASSSASRWRQENVERNLRRVSRCTQVVLDRDHSIGGYVHGARAPHYGVMPGRCLRAEATWSHLVWIRGISRIMYHIYLSCLILFTVSRRRSTSACLYLSSNVSALSYALFHGCCCCGTQRTVELFVYCWYLRLVLFFTPSIYTNSLWKWSKRSWKKRMPM